MSWSKFDDAYVQRTVWEHVDLAARWHYLCLVQECSRNNRFDGRMPYKTALRASDVDDAEAAINALEVVSLVEVSEELGDLRVVDIEEFVPPPSVRNSAAATAVRVARHRKHKNGDHSECLPEHCEMAKEVAPASPVTSPVTRYPGTGQDGLQTEVRTESNASVTRNTSKRCKHGMENGEVLDDFYLTSAERAQGLKGYAVCPQCRAEMQVAS